MGRLSQEEKTRNLLILIKFDSENLFKRVNMRFKEYMRVFALKRTREHFPEIFENQFQDIPLVELTVVSEDLLIQLNNFYQQIDDLFYYLKTTEDMPNAAKDTVKKAIQSIDPTYQTLKLYLEGELGHVESATQPDISDASDSEMDFTSEQSEDFSS